MVNADGNRSGSGDEENAPVSAPAGMVIYNSMVALHKIFQNIYDGIDTASSLVGDKVGSM